MDIHERAKIAAQNLDRAGFDMIESLIELDINQKFKELRHPNLSTYAMKEFRHSKDTAGRYIRVARRAALIPDLREALHKKRVSVSNVSRVVSAITPQNVNEIIERLESGSAEKTERWLRDTGVMSKQVNVKMDVSIRDKALRIRSTLKEKMDLDRAMEISFDEYLERHDPVKIAERNIHKPKPKSGGFHPRRRAVPKHVVHAVNNRDKGRCRFEDEKGCQCENDTYVDRHHMIQVTHGGKDTPENMITLCTFHHELVHQLEFPLEDQKRWLEKLTACMTD